MNECYCCFFPLIIFLIIGMAPAMRSSQISQLEERHPLPPIK